MSVRGMSQSYLGNLIGVSFQQIQKYEYGKNSIPTARLRRICHSLTITPDDLFGKVKINNEKRTWATSHKGTKAMTESLIRHVYEVTLPTASIPAADIGQIIFTTDRESFSFMMPIADFERLGGRIRHLTSKGISRNND
jgi:transcriptional regulator with XRE-family HTH domain